MDGVTAPIGPPLTLPQADARPALVALTATSQPGTEKSTSKAKTDDTDAPTSHATDSGVSAQTIPVAVVVPVMMDGAKPPPAAGPTDLLDASSRQSPVGVAASDAANPPLVGSPSSDDAGSNVDQSANAAIAATTAGQSDSGSGATQPLDQIFAKFMPASPTMPNGKPMSDSAPAPDSKAGAKVDAKTASSLQSSDGSSKDNKLGDATLVDSIKTAPDLKSDVSAANASQQSNAPPTSDSSTQPLPLLNQALPVTPVQAQLVAVRTTSDAPVSIDGLAVEIAARARSGKTRFEIRLDPPELGRVDVRLDIDSQGKVSSHLIVDKPETLDLLRRDAPQLQQALNDSGFKTGDGGMQFSLRDQSFAGRNDQGGQQQRAVPIVISEEDTVPAAIAGRSYRMAGAASGIDITV
jgi:chemotaxis protein MotD